MVKYTATAVAIALAAAVTALGWNGNLTSTYTLAALTSLLAGVGGLGALVIGSPQPNSDALPHAIIGVVILAAITALGLHGTLTANQLAEVFAPVTVATAVVAGNVSKSAASPTSTTGQVN